MRVVFLGSPQFAVPSLRALVHEPDIAVPLVVTQPDRPAGRGRKMTPPPVAVEAQAAGLPLLQPESLRDPQHVARIAEVQPDILLVVAYGEILRRDVLELAPHGALNVHPSLLPRYRGAAPIPAAILNGDRHTGISIIKLVRRLDAGPIIAQSELDITPRDTTTSLSERLAMQSAQMLPDVLRGWVQGQLAAIEQDESLATYTHEWTRSDARIDWSLSAVQIDRLVRAANPWPIAWTTINGSSIAIHESEPLATASPVLTPAHARLQDGRVVVTCGEGVLVLNVVQPASKRAMPALDWFRGLHREVVAFE